MGIFLKFTGKEFRRQGAATVGERTGTVCLGLITGTSKKKVLKMQNKVIRIDEAAVDQRLVGQSHSLGYSWNLANTPFGDRNPMAGYVVLELYAEIF